MVARNYGGPQLSRQKQNACVKSKTIASKANYSGIKSKKIASKAKPSRQKQNSRIESKTLASKAKQSRQKKYWGRGAHIHIFMFCTINLLFLLYGSNNVIGENSSGGPACSKLINKLLQIQHKICAIPTSVQDFKNLLRLNIFYYHFNLTGEHRSYVPILTGMVYQHFLKQHRKCRTSR